ncbi:MAG TPA: ABC transporter ATP-binding protein [Gammaproteobacteria bacterium]|nr:ABC transporter ATP-binding protein [Gammaproteobacteria bacterium]
MNLSRNNLPKTAFPFIFYFLKRQLPGFLGMTSITAIWAANDAFFPYFLKLIVNAVQHFHGKPADIYSAVAGLLALLMAFWIVTEICLRIQGVIQIYTFPAFRANIRKTVFDYVKAHSHEYFSNHFAGSIAKKLADLPSSCQSIMEIICFNFVTALTGSCIVLVMMWMVKPFFACILLVWLCLHLGLTFVFLHRGNYLWQQHSDSVSTLSGKIVDIFSNVSSMRIFARGSYEASYLQDYQREEMRRAKKAMWLIEINRFVLGLSGLGFIFSMVFLMLYYWAHRFITIGDFTQIGMQMIWLLGWIWFISFQMSVFARELGTVNDALNLITKGHDIVDAPKAARLTVTEGRVEFRQVTFAYQKKRHVFRDLNVVIEPGQRVGLVGFSGSGKSTFVNLILRFYDIQSGQILIDGQDIAKVAQDSLREQIAMIPQDPTLFHRTLMENIRYGRLTASDEEVVLAAKLAHCEEFIDKLEQGYDSMVGERGIKLSGGQRQRIAIARAILKNAPILILDEATSSLDTVTEKLIQESLHTVMQDRTTMVIAHRLSTLADMDRILVFHKGKIIEDGTQEALLASGGQFARLWEMQTNGFLPDAAG